METVETRKIEVQFLIGIPGSGKSRYADDQHRAVICRDDIRKALGHEFNVRTEAAVTMIAETMFRAYLERGKDIVLDETNLDPAHMKKFIGIAGGYGAVCVPLVFDRLYDHCKLARQTERGWTDEQITQIFDEKMIPRLDALRENDWQALRELFAMNPRVFSPEALS
jgi:predicted kinase